MKNQRIIVAFKAPYFGAVGSLENPQNTGDVIETIRRADGKGYTVADLERDRDTMQLVKIHRLKTGLTLQAAKKLHAAWLKEGEAKAKARSEKPVPKISEPFAEPPPEHPDPFDEWKIAGQRDRHDIEKARVKILRKKWPRTFKAMDEKAEAEAIEKAYLLDVAEFSGIKAFPITDPKIVKQIAVALYNQTRRTRKTKTMLMDEAIAFHWPKLVYLRNKQFAAAIKKLTGISVTPAQAKQRRVRLGLASRCPAGRRPSSD